MTAPLLRSVVCGSADPGILINYAIGPALAAPRNWRATGQADADEEVPMPGEQPIQEETPRIDDAPVRPLTSPEDTEGG